MKKIIGAIFLLLLFGNLSFAQNRFVIQNKKQTDKIRFELINNLVVIPVEVNGVTLSFILDTGVSKPIIFNFLNMSDTLKIKETERMSLMGLGEGDSIQVYKSKNNVFKVGEAVKLNQDVYAVIDSNLNFGPRLGVSVHGILGFDLFKDLVVEINYSRQYVRLTEPEAYQYKVCRNCERLNIEFYNSKPYVNAKVKINKKTIPVTLLIDSGGSDALWLFEDKTLGITSGDVFFEDFLGHGLNGSVYGKRSKIERFALNNYAFKDINVAYPDSAYIKFARMFKGRNGSIGGSILKRFNTTIDYRNALITLKKNASFKEKFSHNKSGIELAHKGVQIVKEIKYDKEGVKVNDDDNYYSIIDFKKNYNIVLKPSYEIAELRKDSPAHRAGLKKGDVVIAINGKRAYELPLQELIHMFYGEDGKRIKLKIVRGGRETLVFNFQLEDAFK
ncbi:aspartyl protease family protein [Snuella sedimenti]|uniref:Aspartyl protease family protein n=1 Tax=Snuella sedimenti TaxID=2798802 RepID=A0A8J7IJQ6_9FLAO|nr:aspartyl protease family protein [Snuella sedimenti]MBJ6369526.1 aspartyl protease family protein [Snuella sedimenti]